VIAVYAAELEEIIFGEINLPRQSLPQQPFGAKVTRRGPERAMTRRY
jgi:hypothetical protein